MIEDDSGGDDDDDDPKVFEVSAPNYWCVGGFTEAGQPKVGDYIWPKSELTGTRADGESLAAAKERISLGKIVTVTSKKYLIPGEYSDTRIIGKKFWRDEGNDKVSGSRLIPVFKGTIAGRSLEYGDHIVWFEQNNYWTGKENGKRIFSDASTSSDISDSEKADYTVEKLQVGITNWQDPYPDHFPWSLHGANDEDGNPLIPYADYGYMIPTGNSTTLTLPDNYYWFDFGFSDDFDGKFYEYETFDGKFTAWCTKFYGQSSGSVAAYPSKPYFAKDEWNFWSILPGVHASNGYQLRSLVSYEKPVTAINGIYYDTIRNYHLAEGRYVWDAQTYYAWTLSPCLRDGAEVVTIYSDPAVSPEEITAPESGTWGVTLFLPDGESEGTLSWSECGYDGGAATGTYSITSSRGSTYHNSDGGAAAETAECAECAVI